MIPNHLVSLTQEGLVFPGPGVIIASRCADTRSQVKIQGPFSRDSESSGLKV